MSNWLKSSSFSKEQIQHRDWQHELSHTVLQAGNEGMTQALIQQGIVACASSPIKVNGSTNMLKVRHILNYLADSGLSLWPLLRLLRRMPSAVLCDIETHPPENILWYKLILYGSPNNKQTIISDCCYPWPNRNWWPKSERPWLQCQNSHWFQGA